MGFFLPEPQRGKRYFQIVHYMLFFNITDSIITKNLI